MKRAVGTFVLCLMISGILGPATFAQEDVTIIPDVVYGHKYGLAMTFDVFKPKQQNGAGILFMVSGGWYSNWAPPKQLLPMFKALLDNGFTVFAVRHGSSPKFGIAEAVDDVRRSVRFIRLHAKDYGVDPERLGVFGGSAGGHLALMLGTTADKGDPKAKDEVLQQSSRVAAVVAYFPPTDLRGIVWSAPDVHKQYKNFPALNLSVEEGAKLSPLLHVTPDDAPTLLVHGDKDTLVPLKHSTDIRVAMQKQNVPCELIIIEGAGHGFPGKDGVRAGTALLEWFQKHLTKK